jgi:hypothetical protein
MEDRTNAIERTVEVTLARATASSSAKPSRQQEAQDRTVNGRYVWV